MRVLMEEKDKKNMKRKTTTTTTSVTIIYSDTRVVASKYKRRSFTQSDDEP